MQRSRVLVPLLRFIDFALRCLLALLLLPLFLFDGILAGLDIVPRRKTAPIEGVGKNIFVQFKINVSSFIKTSFKRANFVENIRRPVYAIYNAYYKLLCKKKEVVFNRVTFMSGRRDTLGGNPEFVYNQIKDDPNIDFQFLLFSDPNGHYKAKNMFRFVKLYASSKVVIVDDYFRLLNMVNKRPEVKLMQLWHACGRPLRPLALPAWARQAAPSKRTPTTACTMWPLSPLRRSPSITQRASACPMTRCWPPAFPEQIYLWTTQYAQTVQDGFYAKYPQLRDKRIILFAPTFRGNGQMSAYYPADAFHVDEFMEALPADTALLIKYHPFCPERPVIPEGYKDRVLDLSDEDELNDLLFITDLLITDYSSVVFEASLLDIPMLFYAFDLFDYISKRDFYYDFESFVPGKIVFSQRELTEAIVAGDFESEKVPPFKTKFFDHLDGRSSRRVADLILRFIGEEA